MSSNDVKRVAIVGGGLVGALNACYLAKRGFKVDLYELRGDIRNHEAVKGRSINLALSRRGRDALKAVGLEEQVTSNGIPMYARMIHDKDGSRKPIPYGTKDQYIMSIDRRKLNELLLDAAEKYPNVTMHFHHKLVMCDFDSGRCTFEKEDGARIETTVDLVLGTDGAYSSVRRQMMRCMRLDFSQEYIPHGYMELCMPAVNGQFPMETNYLHIWPRNTFMMIGLPNTEDQSFVITLFMPFDNFEKLTTAKDVLEFFEDKFPDSIPLIGKEALVNTYLKSKALPMVSVKCGPYHLRDKVVIMGDAAHAMVPFYGQGMNCGFEDCILFNSLMDEYNNDFSKVLSEFTARRNEDAKAMCDLAMYNYVEMRASVNSKLFLLRKKVDNFLHWLLPNTWVPLYTMVSFTRTRYSECIKNRQWQDKVLTRIGHTCAALMLCGALCGGVLIQRGSHSGLLGNFTNALAESPLVSYLGRTLKG